MNKQVSRDASLHPATVAGIDQHRGKYKPKPQQSKAKVHRINHVVIRTDVWKTAMGLAKGDGKLLEVRDSECVVVHNNADWRWRRQAIAKGIQSG